MLELINFILCILILIPALIILFSLKGKKPNKVKEDILFIEKQILKSLILTFYLLLYLYELLKEDEIEDKNTLNYAKYNIYKTKIICFNIYIVLLFKNNFFLCIEDYFTYTNPNHYFNSLFHKSKNNILYEFISVCTASVLSLLYFYKTPLNFLIILLNFKSNGFIEINEDSPFLIINSPKIVLIFIINIIILILYIALKLKLKKIVFKAREKLFRVLNRKIISTIFYILYISFSFLLFFLKDNKIFRIINSYLFLFVYSIDSFCELKTYSISKFAQYKLSHTIVDSIGSLLRSNKNEDYPTNAFLESLIEETSFRSIKKNNTTTTTDDENEENSLIMPLNNNDVELVLIYRNKIFIEDYFFYYYDFIMNLTFAALLKIYKEKKFSPSNLNNTQLKKELNITESTILEGGEKTNTLASSYTLKKIDTAEEEDTTSKSNINNDEFEFVKKYGRNDFFYVDEIFCDDIEESKYDNLNVKVTSYFTSKCVSNLFEKNLTSKIISESLKSHLKNNYKNEKIINSSKKDISTSNNIFLPYHSILSCNSKEEYFLHLKNMVIKSYDKLLKFDIFESNDDDINLNIDNSNKKIAKMLDRYFNYIKGVGVSSTFIPIVIGIFKVKINSFKTMLIYISCNSLVEDSPLNNNYSYWQLIRFSLKDKTKISSSKYRHSVLIGDDLIFDRKYAVPSIKEDNDSPYNKIEIKNYFNFEETIKHDIIFLKECGIKYSNFLLMYFEYENVQRHEKEGAIKIKKVGDNKAEIINTTYFMPIMREDEESDEDIYIGDHSKKDSENITKPANPPSSFIEENLKNSPENRISDINCNLNINKNEQKINQNKNNEEKNENNINVNLDISKSINNSDNEKKNYTSNSRFQSICGSLSNPEFLDEVMKSFDEGSGKSKNNQEDENSNMINYTEKIKINSYDGYFDDFSCVCLFSFENIFDLNIGCSCRNINYNQLEKNILDNFNNYTSRKHTLLNKSKK